MLFFEYHRVFVTSNSKRKIKTIAKAIEDLFEEMPKHRPKTLVITSENSKTREIQNFITNVKSEILKYQVILPLKTRWTATMVW